MHKKWRGEKIKTIKRILHNDERERERKNCIRLNRTTELYSREARITLHARKRHPPRKFLPLLY